MFKPGDRVRINFPEDRTHGYEGTVSEDGQNNWIWVNLIGFGNYEDPRDSKFPYNEYELINLTKLEILGELGD